MLEGGGGEILRESKPSQRQKTEVQILSEGLLREEVELSLRARQSEQQIQNGLVRSVPKRELQVRGQVSLRSWIKITQKLIISTFIITLLIPITSFGLFIFNLYNH